MRVEPATFQIEVHLWFSGYTPPFWRNLLPPSSGQKNKPSGQNYDSEWANGNQWSPLSRTIKFYPFALLPMPYLLHSSICPISSYVPCHSFQLINKTLFRITGSNRMAHCLGSYSSFPISYNNISAWLTLLPWRQRQHIPPTEWRIFTFTRVRTSNLMENAANLIFYQNNFSILHTFLSA
jgi:hypothetical protein